MPTSPTATVRKQRTAPNTANSMAAMPLSAFANLWANPWARLFHPMALLHQAGHGDADRLGAGAGAIDLQQGIAHEGDGVANHLGAVGVGIVAAGIFQIAVGDIDRPAQH